MLRNQFLLLLMLITCSVSPLRADNGNFSDDNLIQLDGSGSQDPDGDKLRYSWRQIAGPQITLLNSQTARPGFYAEVPGEYQFELIVSDGRIDSAPATVKVLVEEANEIPIAVLPEKVSIILGDTALLDASNSNDPDDDHLVYNFKQLSGPDKILSSTVVQNPVLKLTPAIEGSYSFELIVNDGRVNSQPVQCELEVIRPNNAPIARVNAPQKMVIRTKKKKSQLLTQTDSVIEQKVTIPRINTQNKDSDNVPPRITQAKVRLIKSENLPDMVKEISTLDAEQPLNIAPIASTSADMTVTPGSKVVIKGFGVDPDGDSLQFIWNQVAGPIIPGSPIMRKNLAFIPRKEGVYVFELVVNDGDIKSEPAKCAVTVKNDNIESKTASLDDNSLKNDSDALELAIPKEEPAHAQVPVEKEDDISFRELFSLD